MITNAEEDKTNLPCFFYIGHQLQAMQICNLCNLQSAIWQPLHESARIQKKLVFLESFILAVSAVSRMITIAEAIQTSPASSAMIIHSGLQTTSAIRSI